MTAIFDMDGTLVDNSKYHVKAWEIFLDRHNLTGSEKIWKLFGHTNEYLMKYFFEKELEKEKIKKYAHEKEEIYREIYASELKPVAGVIELLDELKSRSIKTGLATSAPGENVTFVLNHLNASGYFDVVVDDSQISNGKPDPEIFLTCAARLGSPNNQCIVFEDSIHGVKAAKNAHMKAVAVTTTAEKIALDEADLIIDDFTELTVEKLELLLK